LSTDYTFEGFQFAMAAETLLLTYWVPLSVAIVSSGFVIARRLRSSAQPEALKPFHGRTVTFSIHRDIPVFLWALAATISNINGIRIHTGHYTSIWDIFLAIGLALAALSMVALIGVASALVGRTSNELLSSAADLTLTEYTVPALVVAAVFADFVHTLLMISTYLEY